METRATSLAPSPMPEDSPGQSLTIPTPDTESDDTDLPGLPDELWERLVDSGQLHQHSAIQKVKAVLAYSTLGSSRKASRATGVPHETIRYWKTRANWWKDVLHHVHRFNNARHIASLTETMLAAGEELADRIKNGEYVYDKDGNQCLDENGVPKRKKLTAHSLAVDGIAIPGQRRALLMGDATSRTENSGADTLRELKELFQTIGVKNITNDSVVIDQDMAD